MRRLLLSLFCIAVPLAAWHEISLCGTTRETPRERLFFHRQSSARLRPRAAVAAAANPDIGNIAIIEDADGVVARQNEFNLDSKTLRFTPSGAGYTYAVLDGGYDASAAGASTPLAALDDDDSRLVPLPFSFPFYGAVYQQVWVNSDGNLTFGAADHASTDRSLGRMTAGPPRIAPLFDDLNPAQTAGGVRVLAEAARLVITWVAVPEYVSAGIGAKQTFQARLYPDGRIEFAYSGVVPSNAVTGIAPGSLKGSAALVDYRSDSAGVYSGAVAERFGGNLEIDIVTAAQKFYQTHEDAYDYLVIYNNMDIPAGSGAIAYENTVRSTGTGYGSEPRDDGAMFGSPSRLQAVLNMGYLRQYPVDPNALVPARAQAGDTPITTIAHETGHLFLAYASIPDPANPANEPMLGFQNAHWSFLFNSEASLLEGEHILDLGPSAKPRFLTAETVRHYAPLDQYLMGFRPASAVPETLFLITDAPPSLQQQHPASGVAIDGGRQDIRVEDVVQAMGRRTPDSTIAQRHFRFAFILVTSQGVNPSAADLAQMENYRQQFEAFFNKASDANAAADVSLRRGVQFSLAPAAGIVAGSTGTATLTVATAPRADTIVQFQAPNGFAKFPASVTIPAGATTVSFAYTGVAAGVEEVTAAPADPAYETAFARVQVAGAAELRLVQIAADPLVVQLTDVNGLFYSGATVEAETTSGGVAPSSTRTDAHGQARFTWTPGTGADNVLQLRVSGFPSVTLTLHAGSAVPSIASVVNAASFEGGVAAGTIETIFGAHLAGARVLLNSAAVPVLYNSDSQVNFIVPPETPLGAAALTVTGPAGEQASADVTVAALQPGIFAGGVLHSGTGVSVAAAPAKAGDFLEIYCTGLGATRAGTNGLQQTVTTPVVFIGATPVEALFSGLAPGTTGVYQVNVRVPPGLAPGPQSVLLSISLAHSNQVQITVE
jgi:uncharacterized protein (TIGR03437 family)